MRRPTLLLLPLLVLLLATWAGGTTAQTSAGAAAAMEADPKAMEARMRAITSELRCLVCQNQTIADSHSGLAEDLRREVRTLLERGASDDEIRSYMTQRYGNFVLYRPPLEPSTWLLWSAPALLVAAGGIALWLSLRRRAALPADRFEPDPAEAEFRP